MFKVVITKPENAIFDGEFPTKKEAEIEAAWLEHFHNWTTKVVPVSQNSSTNSR